MKLTRPTLVRSARLVAMSKPHLASVVEDRWNRALGGLLERAGWQPRIVGYAGYGGADFVRVLARVVLDRPPDAEPAGATSCGAGGATSSPPRWAGPTVTITVAGQPFVVTSDRSGIVDVRLPKPGLTPGWHRVGLAVAGARAGHRRRPRGRRRRGLRDRQRHRRHGDHDVAAAAAARDVQHVRARRGGAQAGRRHGRAVRRAARHPAGRADDLRLDGSVERRARR